MKIEINSEFHDTHCKSVFELANSLKLPLGTLLIERNGEALLKSEWEAVEIREGDRFEILKVSAGG